MDKDNPPPLPFTEENIHRFKDLYGINLAKVTRYVGSDQQHVLLEKAVNLDSNPLFECIDLWANVRYNVVTKKVKCSLVFRPRGKRLPQGIVECVHSPFYTLYPRDATPTPRVIADATRGVRARLPPEDVFLSLWLFASGLAEFGLEQLLRWVNVAPDVPGNLGFDYGMQADLLSALAKVAPKIGRALVRRELSDLAAMVANGQVSASWISHHASAFFDKWADFEEEMLQDDETALMALRLFPENSTLWPFLEEHPAMLRRILNQIARDPHPALRQQVADHRTTSPALLAQLAQDEDLDVRDAVAENPASPPKALSRLADDPDERIRFLVASNFHTPPAVLNRLCNDASPEVRTRAQLTLNSRK